MAAHSTTASSARSSQASRADATDIGEARHVDVLIVGAGISGVGSAYHLLTQRPGTSFAILERQETFGGTWWTHKFPGIRSDSDLHTFGYRFKPWVGPPIATAAEIRTYMQAIISENGIDRHIHYGHKVLGCVWSSEAKRWTVTAEEVETGERKAYTAKFLWMCQGYYKHEEGYTPEWPGMADFKGPIVHPQTWPTDLDTKGKRVVVIGSGATAATLIPALAGQCAHVTMLQRSPTFFRTGRNAIEIAEELRKLQVDEAWVHEISRRKILYDQAAFTKRTFSEPEKVRAELLSIVRKEVGEGCDVDKHFNPRYRPWQQRIAFIPDADLFRAVRDGRASVVTDEIDRFVANGIKLKSGEILEADVIATATGFHLASMGDIPFEVDGRPVAWNDTVTYRGMMFTDVPNLAWVFGYFRASWTLRVDMVADFVCRLLGHMQATGQQVVIPQLRAEDHNMAILPWIDDDDFNPGYMKRGMHKLPKRGAKREWAHTQDYWTEKDEFPRIDLDGSEFRYG